MVIRVAKADGDKAIAALEANGFKVLTRYEQDLRPFLPAQAAAWGERGVEAPAVALVYP